MKRSIRNLAIVAIAVLSIIAFPVRSYAASYYTFNNHVKAGGVGNWGNNKQYYFITSSAVSDGDTTLIQDAMNTWIYTDDRLSTPISFR